MTLSIWRYSHLALAVSSFVFILLASITGIILAFEPIQFAVEADSNARASSTVSLSTTISALQGKFDEVLDVQVDDYQYVSATLLDKEGNFGQFYIHAQTGEILGELVEPHPIFEWSTNLHRSLFLKSTGRFFVGLSSFLLFLIALSGIALVIKRQRGIKYFFSRIIRENTLQYLHVYLGRLALIPIIIITLTGTYLSAVRFDLIPESASLTISEPSELLSTPQIPSSEFSIFQSLSLDQIRKVEFPFSKDVEDQFILELDQSEIHVNQYTGKVESEIQYPFSQLAKDLSLTLHTGRSNVAWAIVLALSCVGILFFIWSGFAMTFKRIKGKTRNKFKKDDAEIVILTGTESGTTRQFAKVFAEALIKENKRVYIDNLNNYSTYNSMNQLIVFTATYGTGEAPSNANKFSKLVQSTTQKKSFTYSVVGFGSLSYPNFCQFAFETEELLDKHTSAKRLLQTHTIHNKSWESFNQWVNQWSHLNSLDLKLPAQNAATKSKKKLHSFTILNSTLPENRIDNTFTLELECNSASFDSGDLLAILPDHESHERLYSIAKTENGHVLLSVKHHEFGVCSTYLSQLKRGNTLEASIVANSDFHFKSRSHKTIMIATGTGIAPFLGMIQNNTKLKEIELYWGGKTRQSLYLYENLLADCKANGRLSNLYAAYSRESVLKFYVQDFLLRDKQKIALALKQGSTIMICGSITMQKGVVDTLNQIVLELNHKPLSCYQNRGQLKMDCY